MAGRPGRGLAVDATAGRGLTVHAAAGRPDAGDTPTALRLADHAARTRVDLADAIDTGVCRIRQEVRALLPDDGTHPAVVGSCDDGRERRRDRIDRGLS